MAKLTKVNFKISIPDEFELDEKKYLISSVKETFRKLKGAHKADLFRYCYLYKFGGIYLDITKDRLYTCKSNSQGCGIQKYSR